MNSAASREHGLGNLLYVQDPRTKIRWLIDGGALLSILPPLPAQRKNGPNGTKLSAANGTPIPCYGTTRHRVTLGNKVYAFNFIIADVKQAIIGADFLAHFYLAPNHRDGCLINLQSLETLQTDFDTKSAKNTHQFRQPKRK